MPEIKVTKEMIKEARRKYFKNYRKNNKEKIIKINQRYWEKQALKNLRG